MPGAGTRPSQQPRTRASVGRRHRILAGSKNLRRRLLEPLEPAASRLNDRDTRRHRFERDMPSARRRSRAPTARARPFEEQTASRSSLSIGELAPSRPRARECRARRSNTTSSWRPQVLTSSNKRRRPHSTSQVDMTSARTCKPFSGANFAQKVFDAEAGGVRRPALMPRHADTQRDDGHFRVRWRRGPP